MRAALKAVETFQQQKQPLSSSIRGACSDNGKENIGVTRNSKVTNGGAAASRKAAADDLAASVRHILQPAIEQMAVLTNGSGSTVANVNTAATLNAPLLSLQHHYATTSPPSSPSNKRGSHTLSHDEEISRVHKAMAEQLSAVAQAQESMTALMASLNVVPAGLQEDKKCATRREDVGRALVDEAIQSVAVASLQAEKDSSKLIEMVR
jgi:hypothetical protein